MIRAEWTIGDEQEVSPGNYAKLVAEHLGWLIWSFETATGTYLGINKPAEGLPHPIPLGVQQAFFGKPPYASLHVHGPRPWISIHGTHLHSTTKYRQVGDRFMKDAKLGVDIDPAQVDGARIEVMVSSMPGPRSFSKVVQDHGFIDMTGAAAVLAMANDMRAK